VVATTVESRPSAEAAGETDGRRTAPSPPTPPFSSAVMEADPEIEGPFAAVPLEIVPETSPESVPRIIAQTPSETALGVASGIGSEITLEVASGTDTELTVDVASGFIPETTLETVSATTLESLLEAPGNASATTPETAPNGRFEIIPETRPDIATGAALETATEISPGIALQVTPKIPSEIGPGETPGVAASEVESWAPAAEPVSPSPEVSGVSGFDADPRRILRLEEEFGVAPRPSEPPARKEAISAALETPAPQVGAAGFPVRGGAASQASLPADLAPEGRAEPSPERCQPGPEAVPDDVWVIDPSDLTFDPAFLDGLYQAPHANLGPLVPGTRGKATREPAAEDSRSAAEHSGAPLPLLKGEAVTVGEPPIPSPASAGIPVEVPPAPVAEDVAEPTAESLAAPVAEIVAVPATEPITEAVAADSPLDVVAEPAVPGAAEPEPLEVLPALEASWPFVPESAAPVVEAVAKLVAESAAAPAGGTVAKPAGEATAKPVAEVVAVPVAAPPVEAVAESATEPVAEAVAAGRPLDVIAEPASRERLSAVAPSEGPGVQVCTPPAAPPAEEGIQEAVEVFERLLDSLQEAPATLQEAPAAAQTLAVDSLPEPASAPRDVTTKTPTETARPVVARDETAAPAPEPEVLTPAAPDEKAVPADVADTRPASRGPMPAFEFEFVETPAAFVEAVGPEPPGCAGDDTAEALPLPAAPAVVSLPEVAPAPAARVANPPRAPALPTLDIAAAPAGSTTAWSAARAPLPGHAPAAHAGRVLTFEPGPVPGEPAVPTPAGRARSVLTSARVLAFSLRERALGLGRAVPGRLVELGRTRIYWKPAAVAALVLVALGGVRLATAYWFRTPPPTGGLVVETVPEGLDVFIDSTLRGRTPMSLTLPAGDHVLELRGKGLARTLPVRIAPGIQAEERVSWPLSVRTGSLRVESEPTKANVSIDGQPKGVTPLTIEDLPARVHTLVVQGRGGRVERAVTIEPERTTTVKVPVFPGWMKVFAPFDLQVLEGSRLLGTTDVDRIMLRAGRHDIELVNEELGYRVVRQVDITPGAVTPLSIELPKGTLQIDTPPGFEVWLDGERVGETPLAPLEVSLGTHEVRLKHPQSGERRQVVVVTLRGPAKVTAEGQESGK
jgi:hypothetical protein